MRVAVIGVGYVGLTTALSLAFLGHEVTGVDTDTTKIELLKRGKSPIHEAGLEQLLVDARDNIRFTDSIDGVAGEAEIVMIAVGTPATESGEADTGYVESVTREIAGSLVQGNSYTVVIKSTVPIGTNRRIAHVVGRVLAERGVQAAVCFASNPEFLREGLALRDTFYPDRIVVGSEQQQAVESVRRLYRPILEQTFTPPGYLPRPEGFALPPMMTTDPTSAEMIKYASNAFLALKISFINEIAGLCERMGADVTEVARGVGMDSRIGSRFFQAGLGWGGSCFPKDTSALLAMASGYNYTMPVIKAARQINDRQRQAVIEKLQAALKVLRGRSIAVLGLAFKPDTDDIRYAPSLDVIQALVGLGAHVRAHDPIAITNTKKVLDNMDIEFIEDPYQTAAGCDAVVVATEWGAYQRLNLTRLAEQMRTRVLVDGRNIYTPEDARSAGFTYIGMGR